MGNFTPKNYFIFYALFYILYFRYKTHIQNNDTHTNFTKFYYFSHR